MDIKVNLLIQKSWKSDGKPQSNEEKYGENWFLYRFIDIGRIQFDKERLNLIFCQPIELIRFYLLLLFNS